jgi:Tfp pilus assembly protein PilO
MSERKKLFLVLGAGLLCAGGLVALNIWQSGQIEESRSKVAGIQSNIDSARSLVESTPPLEREVIVLRELGEVMRGILPDTDDVNNLVRTFQRLSEESGVRISGLKKKTDNANKRNTADFDRVAYTLSLEGDAFQLLDFFDLIESHSRFMRVPNFRITAANRNDLEKLGVPAHKVTLDVETYVYEPKKDVKPVTVEGYDRKRELLLGEIERRKESLQVSAYVYRGARGRRDPWIDPRVPVLLESMTLLSVQEQMELVQKLSDRIEEVFKTWEQVQKAENVIIEMMARAQMEEQLARLEEDVRRVVSERSIAYVPSQTRLQDEVIDRLNELRGKLVASDIGRGPSETQLREMERTMVAHRASGEYQLMLEAFGSIDNRLTAIETDPLRRPLIDRLRDLAYEARTVIDFEKVQLDVGGVVLIEGGAPIVMINGRSLSEGDLIGQDLIVRSIRRDEIEFIFRGIVFARRF